MINKRLLIKNLLAYVGENRFYDKKRQLNLQLPEGKAKFLKHVCALSNANVGNNSYLVVGVEDEDNALVGTDFFDDSHIQHLVNSYLEPAPEVVYDNVFFPDLEGNKVIGLVTIRPKMEVSRFKKSIYTIKAGTIFERIGSNSVPVKKVKHRIAEQDLVVADLERNAHNGIAHTLDGVMSFFEKRGKDIKAKYLVFKDFFVLCWAGKKQEIRQKKYFSRVDVMLINEQVKLFYSHQDVVEIRYDANRFVITEYVALRLGSRNRWFPFEVVEIRFYENGTYFIDRKMVFSFPKMQLNKLQRKYEGYEKMLQKVRNLEDLDVLEQKEMIHLPTNLMMCYLNGITEAKSVMEEAKPYFRQDAKMYEKFKSSMRILRKLKYNNQLKNDAK